MRPNVAERGRRDDERCARVSRGRERHERLPEPDVVGEQSTAVSIEERSDALDALALVRMERDGAELLMTPMRSEHVCRDRGPDVVGRRDGHGLVSMSAATCEERSRYASRTRSKSSSSLSRGAAANSVRARSQSRGKGNCPTVQPRYRR